VGAGKQFKAGSVSRRSTAVMALRRARLAFLMVWRKRFPPPAEVLRRDQKYADRPRLLAESKLAAEEFHWADVSRRADAQQEGHVVNPHSHRQGK
jgi:hypothetical protein